jgi:hypothetical protein
MATPPPKRQAATSALRPDLERKPKNMDIPKPRQVATHPTIASHAVLFIFGPSEKPSSKKADSL